MKTFSALNLGVLALLGLTACQADGLPSEPAAPPVTQPELDVGGVLNSWVSRPTMPTGRGGLMSASVNGIIYAIGGKNSNGTLATVEAYNPSTTTLLPWRARAALPEARAHANGATAIDGKIYVPGGYVLSNDERVAKASLYVYDPAANTWSQRAPMPREAFGGVSVAINGKLFVYVTFQTNGALDAALYRYDPSTDTWTGRAHPTAVQLAATAGVINGKLYLAGGFSGSNSPVATLSVFNPGTNTWTTKAPMPTARGGAAGRAIDGKLYVAGGSVGLSTQALGMTEMYDPATNSWSAKAAMITPRYAAGTAVVNGALYVIGGYGGGRKNEKYIP